MKLFVPRRSKPLSPERRRWTWFRQSGIQIVIGFAAAMTLLCLACTNITIEIRHIPDHKPSGYFQAGNGRADITPPAGYPFFGFSLTGKHKARGFKTRLYARAFYLEGADGEAVALVQCDLGGISAALHRRVAKLIADSTGLGPDRIMLAATHTHSGPGGYFAAEYYNNWAAGEPGFDPGLLDFLSDRIAGAIWDAYRTRGPAVAATGVCDIPGVSYNRSPEAYLDNFESVTVSHPYDKNEGVNKRLTMLRIDRIIKGDTLPLGALTNFAIHGTSIGPNNDLYNGDCFAAAERYLEAAIRGRYKIPDSLEVIHALTTGNAGDVGPAFVRQLRGFDETDRLGRQIAEPAFELFRSLDIHLTDDIAIQRAYREISLRHTIASTENTPLTPPHAGNPVLGGTEDGYSPLHFIWPGAEGSRARSADISFGKIGISLALGPFSWNGRDSAKIFAAGGLHSHLLPESGFPQLMTLQTVRVGDLLLLAVPGEITTVMGNQVIHACSTKAAPLLNIKHTAIVTLANQYMSYFSTPPEYNAQHYEGAHSFWGPHAGEFVSDELLDLVEQMPAPQQLSLPRKWTFSPGNQHHFADFKPQNRNPNLIDTFLVDTTVTRRRIISVYWWDESPQHLDLTALNWRIEVPKKNGAWRTFKRPGITDDGGMPVDDTGLDLTVAHCDRQETKDALRRVGKEKSAKPKCKTLWRVSWAAPEIPPARFRFVLYDRLGKHPPIKQGATLSSTNPIP